MVLPLAIMVSGDTEERTRELLEANDYFGAAEGQVERVARCVCVCMYVCSLCVCVGVCVYL